jgi:alpha-L-rhamnosidase
MRVVGLRCEYHDEPLGLDVACPRLFWRVESDTPGDRQTAYRILAASSPQQLLADDADLWDSGRVASAETTHLPYGGAPLASRQAVWWKVEAWDAAGTPSGFSRPGHWTMGLLDRAAWRSAAIGLEAEPPADLVRSELTLVGCQWVWLAGTAAGAELAPGTAVFRRHLELPLNRRIRHAEILLTADTRFTLAVNGVVVGASDAPPDTWIRGKLLSIGRWLSPGENVLAIEVVHDGPKAGLIGRLRVELEDGSQIEETIAPPWRAGSGPIADWSAYDRDDFWPPVAVLAEYPQAPWQTFPASHAVVPQPCPLLRRTFQVDQPVRRATVYVTALGLYELRLNGGKVGRDLLRPGWTDYHTRLAYQTYDVTAAIRQGPNVIGAILGDGWYAGHVAWMEAFYGRHKRLICQLEIEHEDGSLATIAADDQWRGRYGGTQYADLLHGEAFDARREPSGWDAPGYADGEWSPVTVDDLPATSLEWSPGPPVRRMAEIKPVALTEPAPGCFVFDLGQNLVGWARLKLRAPAGAQVRLQFAEMLNPDGTPYLTNLRSARAIDTFVTRGGGLETWEPRFTFHGFRYVEVQGWPGKPPLDAVTGIVLHSDMPHSGSFECSSELLNQLQHNIEWGQRGNYLEVPTDCPQRDERLGWTGDAQVFARTGCFNFEAASFFSKWLTDLHDAQDASGFVPDVAPRTAMGGPSAAWADAALICPWTVWLCYADREVLSRHWDMMTRWLDWQTANSTAHLRPKGGYGDWLQLDCETPTDLIQTAFYAYGAQLAAEVAGVLDKAAEQQRYAALAAAIRTAWRARFVDGAGRIEGDTQCGYALALAFDLLPEPERPPAAARLVELLAARDGLISTGFVGTPYLCHVLTRFGYLAQAYALATEERYPSWGYSIRHGATTMWERWDGWTAERGFQTPGMNSFNHYAYGAIGSWLYQVVAGLEIDPQVPGYRRLIVRPRPGGGLSWARASLDTLHGRAACGWRLDGELLKVELTVPCNTTAQVWLPGREEAVEVGAGRHEFSVAAV